MRGLMPRSGAGAVRSLGRLTCWVGLQTGYHFSEKTKDQLLSGHRVGSGEPGASRISPLANVQSRQGASTPLPLHPPGLSGWGEPVRQGEIKVMGPLGVIGRRMPYVLGTECRLGVGGAVRTRTVRSVLGGRCPRGVVPTVRLTFGSLLVLQMPL